MRKSKDLQIDRERFRIDRLPNGSIISDGVLQLPDGKTVKDLPCPCQWLAGSLFLSKCFGVTQQRIYQLRDLGVLTPEEDLLDGEQVYRFSLAIRDYAEYKVFGLDGIFSGVLARDAGKDSGIGGIMAGLDDLIEI